MTDASNVNFDIYAIARSRESAVPALRLDGPVRPMNDNDSAGVTLRHFLCAIYSCPFCRIDRRRDGTLVGFDLPAPSARRRDVKNDGRMNGSSARSREKLMRVPVFAQFIQVTGFGNARHAMRRLPIPSHSVCAPPELMNAPVAHFLHLPRITENDFVRGHFVGRTAIFQEWREPSAQLGNPLPVANAQRTSGQTSAPFGQQIVPMSRFTET
jgi:hypothetical protein